MRNVLERNFVTSVGRFSLTRKSRDLFNMSLRLPPPLLVLTLSSVNELMNEARFTKVSNCVNY